MLGKGYSSMVCESALEFCMEDQQCGVGHGIRGSWQRTDQAPLQLELQSGRKQEVADGLNQRFD